MIICSINVRGGVNKKTKPYKIIQYFSKREFDILLLQEVGTIKTKTKELLEKELDVKIYKGPELAQKRNIGVVCLIKNESKINVSHVSYPQCIGEGRLQKITFSLDEKSYDLINIYGSAHQPAKRPQWAALQKYLVNTQNDLIVMGDFNACIKANEKVGNLDRKYIDDNLISLIRTTKLVDVASLTNNNTHTYIGEKATTLIDRILINDNIRQQFFGYTNEICPFSDHNLISIRVFKPDERHEHRPKRRYRHWKLNISLLDDPDTVNKIINLWDEWRFFICQYNTITEWYLRGKDKVKNLLIEIGKRKAKERNNRELHLEKNLNEEIRKTNPDPAKLKQWKTEINKIIDYKIEGIKVRSRLQTMPKEERGSRNFFNIENRKKKEKVPDELITKSGNLIEDSTQINNEIHQYYQSLYNSETIDKTALNKLISDYNPPGNITQNDQDAMNAPFTIKELERALSKMNNNKSPGMDGLPKEYYTKLWDHIKYDILAYSQELDLLKSLPEKSTTGIIKLIYKKNDARYLKNWRPISLLNVDFKLITSMIAQRLSNVLPKLISPNQSCGVKNRFIFENLMTIEQLLQAFEFQKSKFSHLENSKIISLDMEKAFDRVEHKYLFHVLEKMKVGTKLLNRIKLIYTDIHQIVETPFGYTDKVKLNRGIRQGCALSMCLFVLSIEPFLQSISKNLDGMKIQRDTCLKCLSYADDTVLFLKNDNEKQKVKHVINTYEKASGARINEEKSQELQLTSNATEEQDTLEILGIDFSLKNKDRTNINWDKVIKKIRKNLIPFTYRNLTIMGKITVINAYVISLIQYTGRVIPPYKKHLRQINAILYTFIKNERPYGYKSIEIQRPQKNGGFGMPSLEDKVLAISCIWLKYLMNKQEANYWTGLFRENLRTPPKPDQNSIHHNILQIKDKEKIDWKATTLAEVYKFIRVRKICKYKIEDDLANTFNWQDIWESWYKKDINNKIKIEMHRAITNKITEGRVVNKSGNCPLCDYSFVISRDHIYLNCRGVKSLIELIRNTENIEIGQNIFYEKYQNKHEAEICYIYVYTINTIRVTQIGKWGTVSQDFLINSFLDNKKWLNCTLKHVTQM